MGLLSSVVGSIFGGGGNQSTNSQQASSESETIGATTEGSYDTENNNTSNNNAGSVTGGANSENTNSNSNNSSAVDTSIYGGAGSTISVALGDAERQSATGSAASAASSQASDFGIPAIPVGSGIGPSEATAVGLPDGAGPLSTTDKVAIYGGIGVVVLIIVLYAFKK